jgi:hypothetical protein
MIDLAEQARLSAAAYSQRFRLLRRNRIITNQPKSER